MTEVGNPPTLLTVPETTCYSRSVSRNSSITARGCSPSSSTISLASSQQHHAPRARRSPSPAASVSVSGGPSSRPQTAYNNIFSTSSFPSLRLNQRNSSRASISSTVTRSSATSLYEFRVEGPETATSDHLSATDEGGDIADLTHDIASLGNTDEEIILGLECITPTMTEDKKYTPPRLTTSQVDNMKIKVIPWLYFGGPNHEPMQTWERHTTPEGNIYFHDKQRGVMTLSDIDNPKELAWVEDVVQSWMRVKHLHSQNLPEDTELVLEHCGEGYYLVSWTNQYIAWLRDVDPVLITKGHRDPISQSHLDHAVQSEFCEHPQLFHSSSQSDRKHVSTFSNSYAIDRHSYKELKSVMLCGYSDVISSETTTFPYESETLRHVVRLIHKLDYEEHSAYHTSIVARFLHLLHWERFLHLYGQRYARLSRLDSVFEDLPGPETRFFQICNLLLFYLPALYNTELKKVYVDRTIHYNLWRRFISELKDDWQNSMTPATVILSTNIGFLAIQSLDNIYSYSRTLAQIASYVSALLSLFDLIVVHILVRKHRQHVSDTAERGLQFLVSRTDLFGMEWLAITISLPGGLFIWSMITFLLALEFIFYHHSIASTMITLSIIATPLVTAIATLLFVNYMSESGPLEEKFMLLRKLLSWRLRLKRGSQDPSYELRSNGFLAGIACFPISLRRNSSSESIPLPTFGIPTHDAAT